MLHSVYMVVVMACLACSACMDMGSRCPIRDKVSNYEYVCKVQLSTNK